MSKYVERYRPIVDNAFNKVLGKGRVISLTELARW